MKKLLLSTAVLIFGVMVNAQNVPRSNKQEHTNRVLADKCLRSEPYPWTAEHTGIANINEIGVDRLEKARVAFCEKWKSAVDRLRAQGVKPTPVAAAPVVKPAEPVVPAPLVEPAKVPVEVSQPTREPISGQAARQKALDDVLIHKCVPETFAWTYENTQIVNIDKLDVAKFERDRVALCERNKARVEELRRQRAGSPVVKPAEPVVPAPLVEPAKVPVDVPQPSKAPISGQAARQKALDDVLIHKCVPETFAWTYENTHIVNIDKLDVAKFERDRVALCERNKARVEELRRQKSGK